MEGLAPLLIPLVFKLFNRLTPSWKMYIGAAGKAVLYLIEVLDLYRKPSDYVKAVKS